MFSVILLVAHLLLVARFQDGAGFTGFEFGNFDLAAPVLNALLEFEDFVLLHDELDGVSGLLVLLNLANEPFLFVTLHH